MRRFEVGSQKFSAQGFVDFIGDQGAGVDGQIVFSPQLRWDIGHAFGGAENKYNLGLEYTHFINKFGVTGVHGKFRASICRDEILTIFRRPT
ncbi:hypothetical protein ACFFUT_10350 [Pseudohalocynthiibacter aestuariivivens]|jgi:hypothetical protein|uniref:Porin n=1 Tax=Pseudohalocynthiibacter aestuariivivens TaxID=1591409 RepID=A0ABV5JI90_9RHOB|nr:MULTISPECIES: hypothetical protein [Pseudohalocynthiibacter]MBS9717778.1 hypothetical protein [Pseudohalocynthiibacter aestuariivivens]MCK0103072.1 hypothetical protein [Pseudohalocynthiibacter sp. F2068]